MTVEQWLGMLPSRFRLRALANAKKAKTLKLEAETPALALLKAFTWFDSPEKEEFWEVCYQRIKEQWEK